MQIIEMPTNSVEYCEKSTIGRFCVIILWSQPMTVSMVLKCTAMPIDIDCFKESIDINDDCFKELLSAVSTIKVDTDV